jgi:outer membrane lipoprotein-sorting protein
MIVLVALALLLQEKTAEETFRKIEEQIESAGSVSVRYKVEGMADGEKSQMSLTLLLKEGNKVRLTIQGDRRGKEISGELICDGERVGMPGGKEKPEKAPPGFKNSNATILVRSGSLSALQYITLWGRDLGKEKTTLQVSDFKADSDDGNAKTIRYRLRVGKSELETKLWYDPKTHAILKRRFSGKADGAECSVMETYDEFLLNTEIPEERFKLREK